MTAVDWLQSAVQVGCSCCGSFLAIWLALGLLALAQRKKRG